MSIEPIVMLVDDDRDTRESVAKMLELAGLRVAAYSTPDELLAAYKPDVSGCLVIDLKLPGMSGRELLRALSDKGCEHPFIFITGYGDVPTAVEAMRNGAIDFLEKPFDRNKLVQSVREALTADARKRQHIAHLNEIRKEIDSLTPREREVMHLVAEGLLTKQIASQLGISERTVEVHRSRVTRKMHVKSVAQLVKKLNALT